MLVKTVTEQEMAVMAGKLAGLLVAGWSVGLKGELGAGKTTFVRYLCQALGCSDPITSPTFVLAHEYHCKDGLLIEHWDLYRVPARPEELFLPADDKTIRLIEWIGKFPEFEAEMDLVISFAFTDSPDQRTIELKAVTANIELDHL